VSGRTAEAALLAVALVGTPAAPAEAAGARPAPALPAVEPPTPPPVRTGPPPGRRPGPATGLRAPERCGPPPADVPSPDRTTSNPGAERMRLTEAHRLATGAGQVIAVIDTGVYPHERFGSRLRPGGDYLTGGDGLDDCDGHGTAVAGILAASDGERDTGGVVGIAPDAQVLAIRQSSPTHEVLGPDAALRPAGDTETLADAIVLAVRGGATVINISEAVCLPPEQGAEAGEPVHAALRYAVRADVVVVAAAGNSGVGSCAGPGEDPAGQVSLPGWYDPELLTVAAVGPDDAPAPFTVPGPWVDVAAPGTGLRSLAVGGGTTGSGVDGTSFAAPWVAGLAALVRQRFPRLSAEQVADRILATARRPPGRQSDALGHGVIDPVAALTAVPAVLVPDPAAENRTADLAGTTPGPGAPPAPWPVDLVAAGVLLAAAAAAAVRPRRGARRTVPDRTG
jgi:membrane-anchored mycosin MYCP